MEHTAHIADHADHAVLPPSYQDAMKRPDWLDVVAPYVPLREYARLCLVDKRFYQQFAPRLWNDPLAVPRSLNRDTDPGRLSADFLIRAPTLSLVRSFDARCLFTDTSTLYQDSHNSSALSNLFDYIARAFPQLRCIFLDGYPGLLAEGLVHQPNSGQLPPVESPLLLSVARCPTELLPSFFAASYLRSLVYLDVSDMPGSLQKPVARHTLSSANLPNLRILKARGREMDTATAILLFRTFEDQLWSVDLSRNKLTDHVFDPMHRFSFAALRLRTDRFAVEGRIIYFARPGVSPSIRFVAESDWSASFSHPRRHIADAPYYTSSAEDGPPPSFTPRMNGRVKIRPDSADALKTIFSGNAGSHSPSLEDVQGLDICRSNQGITHLYLNGNNISAAAFAWMIRDSPGQLQHLECDSMSFKLPEAAPRSWLSRARLSGTLGWAHVFRPVFSSNLQVLRVHHSVVTQLLSVELSDLSAMANLWVAETHVLPRAELAYPEAFVPDMNPRLQSLVLTRIPRYSTGPLIDKLISFLKLASIQERAIQDIETARRHGPVTLLGLRHIRLEFEPDPREQLGDDSDGEFDLDAGAVMDETEEFSFFGESKWSSTRPSSTAAAAKHAPKPTPSADQSARPGPAHIPSLSPETRTSPGPQPETHPSAQPQPQPEPEPAPEPAPEPEPEPEHITHTWTPPDTASPETEQIWIGSPSSSISNDNSKPTAKQEYTRLLRTHPLLKTNPVSVTPCHVAAGAPRAGWLFSAAWEAILCPLGDHTTSTSTSSSSTTSPKPTRADLKGMRDVVAAVKGYRVETRRAYEEACRRVGEDGEGGGDGERVRWGAPHFHWGGRLEVLLGEDTGGGGGGFYR